MSSSVRSILVFSVYLFGLGAVLLLVPNLLLGLFGVPATSEVWIRVVGMLVLFLGVYYLQVARHGLTQFIRWTVPLRASVIVFFGAFVALGLGHPALILFGAVDLLGAVWTGLALRAERR